MFIRTREDILVPISAIEYIGRAHQESYCGMPMHVRSVKARGWESDNLTITADDTEKLAAVIIRAQSGYELLLAPPYEPEEFWFSRAPIIAWRVDLQGSWPEPITVGGDESLSGHKAILMPGGKVEIQCDRTFDNIGAWEKYVRKEHKDAKAKASNEASNDRRSPVEV